MRNSNALLRTGGLATAHMQQLAGDDNEDIVVRGVGTVPVNDLMLARGVTPTYPLEYFESNGWLRPTVTLPELRPQAKSIEYFGYIRDLVKKDPPGVASVLAYIEILMSSLVGSQIATKCSGASGPGHVDHRRIPGVSRQ